MTNENGKYKKIIEILRKSKPDMISPEKVGEEVIIRIRNRSYNAGHISEFIESLFGWVYIGWMRRSLVGAAVILVAVFVYQQAFILKQVRNISEQVVNIGNEPGSVFTSDFGKRLTLYKISNRFTSAGEIRVSEKQLEELLDSYDDLQVKYKDLLRIIEEDPELKKQIENKLSEGRNYKPDI
jgi:hypothetical protein